VKRKNRKPLINLVVISDLHCGCRLGLCPPSAALDDGAIYYHTPVQAAIWNAWTEFWKVWVPQVTRNEPYAVALNGDALDNRHHKTVTQISQSLADQEKIAIAVLEPVVARCDKFYMLRGTTPAHGGPSGEDEERLARHLGAIPDQDGRFARWELWLEIGVGLVHLTHHIGTAGSLAYETTGIQKELEQSFVEASRWGNRHPDVIIRSHRHRNVETRIQTAHGFSTACVTAGWQAKTPFAFKVTGGRQTLPQIGGTLVRSGDEDVYTRHRLWTLDRPKTEQPMIQR